VLGSGGWGVTVGATSCSGIRGAVLNGTSVAGSWANLFPLVVLGAVSIPLGLAVFRAGERYAKRHGKLKRSG
jgi:ABC-2 type transport system permease protein